MSNGRSWPNGPGSTPSHVAIVLRPKGRFSFAPPSMTLLTSKVRGLRGKDRREILCLHSGKDGSRVGGETRSPPQQVRVRKVGRWEGTLPREGGVRHHLRAETDEDGAPKSEEREEREMALYTRANSIQPPSQPPSQPEKTREESTRKDTA